jgi:hypothetical protein
MHRSMIKCFCRKHYIKSLLSEVIGLLFVIYPPKDQMMRGTDLGRYISHAKMRRNLFYICMCMNVYKTYIRMAMLVYFLI